MAVKKDFGKVIGQVAGVRIRQINKTSVVKGKNVTKSTEIGLFMGKKPIQMGFKNKESAIVRATEIVSEIVK